MGITDDLVRIRRAEELDRAFPPETRTLVFEGIRIEFGVGACPWCERLENVYYDARDGKWIESRCPHCPDLPRALRSSQAQTYPAGSIPMDENRDRR